jgi:hypothetical protein
VGPETPISPCSKSTMHPLIQVPCLHRGCRTGLPPFLHPYPSIFSIFPPLFPPCSIIATPLLLPHHPSPPTTLIYSSLLFPFPFLFFFFSLSTPTLPLTHAVLPYSPRSSIPHFSPQFCCFFFFSFFFFFFFFLWSRPADHPPSSVTSTRSPLYPYHSRHTSEIQNKGNTM